MNKFSINDVSILPHSDNIKQSQVFLFSKLEIFQVECKLKFVNSKFDLKVTGINIQIGMEIMRKRVSFHTAIYCSTRVCNLAHHVTGKGGNL